jgi:transposase
MRPLRLSPEERERLEHWAGGRDRRLARRASIVLGFAEGEEAKALARRFRLSEPTAAKWRTRFEGSRLAGLVDAARSGAPRRILAHDVERVIARLREPPPPGQARWTTRSLARTCGVSQTTVSRIWRAHGIDPRAPGVPPAIPTGGNGRAERQPVLATAVHDPREAGGTELALLARELGELRAIAPPEQGPFLRVALEAVEAALSSSTVTRMRAAREGSRVMRGRTEAALAQARTLVKEARARLAALRAAGNSWAQRSNEEAADDDPREPRDDY